MFRNLSYEAAYLAFTVSSVSLSVPHNMTEILQTISQEVCLAGAWTPMLCQSQVVSNICTGSGLQHPGVACQELGSLALLGKEWGQGRKEPQKSQPDGQPQLPLSMETGIMDAEVVC